MDEQSFTITQISSFCLLSLLILVTVAVMQTYSLFRPPPDVMKVQGSGREDGSNSLMRLHFFFYQRWKIWRTLRRSQQDRPLSRRRSLQSHNPDREVLNFKRRWDVMTPNAARTTFALLFPLWSWLSSLSLLFMYHLNNFLPEQIEPSHYFFFF